MDFQVMDTQTIELLGRNRLMTELIRAGLEVAIPARDRGIDLIVYLDLSTKSEKFVARPIQMKAASRQVFSLNIKYAKISDLLIAYVWGLDDPEKSETYAMTYPEAFTIAEALGWTKTAAWANGNYDNTHPGKKIREALDHYRMTPEKWKERILGTFHGKA